MMTYSSREPPARKSFIRRIRLAKEKRGDVAKTDKVACHNVALQQPPTNSPDWVGITGPSDRQESESPPVIPAADDNRCGANA
jgi:hypothetical protein